MFLQQLVKAERMKNAECQKNIKKKKNEAGGNAKTRKTMKTAQYWFSLSLVLQNTV